MNTTGMAGKSRPHGGTGGWYRGEKGSGRGVSRERSLVLVLLLMILAGSSIAGAQESGQSEDDPFDTSAFDSGVQAALGEGGAEKVEFLAGGIFLPSVQAVATEGFKGDYSSGSLSGKITGKVTIPRYGSLSMTYGISQQIFQGRGGDYPAVAGKNLLSPTFTLSELHYSFDIAKAAFFRFGNQLVAWGPSRIWTPVDFINLQKADFFQSLDVRVGKPGLRLHVPLKASNIFAFADFSATVASGVVRDAARYTNLGLRYDLTFAGFEAGITAYGGLETQARAGLDISGRLLGSTVYGEAAVLPGYGSHDFSWMASAGFERKLGELRKLTLTGEFFHRSDGEADESRYLSMIAAGTFSPTYAGKFYAYAGLTAEDLFSQDLSTSISVLANLSDLSASVRLTESVSVSGLPPFSVSIGWTGGGPGKAFTIFSGNNTVSATIQTRVEF